MRFGCYLLAVTVAVIGLAATRDGAQAAGCEAPRDAADFVVDVTIDAGEPTIHNHLSKAQLGTTSVHGRRGQILGLANTGVQMQVHIQSRVREWRNVHCFWVERANVVLSYQQLDVNIAAEYEPGSCQYEAVLDHEKEHVEVARSIMSPYAQQIRQALTTLAIPTSHLPALANSPDIAGQEVREIFERTLAPVRDQIDRLLVERQAEVDSPENYRRTWRRCRHW